MYNMHSLTYLVVKHGVSTNNYDFYRRFIKSFSRVVLYDFEATSPVLAGGLINSLVFAKKKN